MYLYLLLMPWLCYSLSLATSFSLTRQNFSNIEIDVPAFQNPGILYAIRDLSAKAVFSWNITHIMVPLNKTHNKLVFTVSEWPIQLQYITYDLLVSQKSMDFRVHQLNITEYQTHLSYQQQDSKWKYDIVLFPVGFSKSTMTMGFMWMPVPLQNLYVVHYMDHQSDLVDDKGNFGVNWVSFNICFLRKNLTTPSMLPLNSYQGYQTIKKDSTVPYFVGVNKIHKSLANIRISQTISDINYESGGVEAVAIAYQLSNFYDLRTYQLQTKVQVANFNAILSIVLSVVLVSCIVYWYIRQKGRSSISLWAGTNDNLGPHELVQENL